MKTCKALLATTLFGGSIVPVSALAHEALVAHANPHTSILSDFLPSINSLILIFLGVLITSVAALWRVRRKK